MKMRRIAFPAGLFLCLGLTSCFTHPGSKVPAKVSPPVSAFARFDAAPSLNASDIPALFDPAKLTVGSRAQYKSVVLDGTGTHPLEVFQRKLQSIAPGSAGPSYHILRDNENGYLLFEADRCAISHAFVFGQSRTLHERGARRLGQGAGDILVHGLGGEPTSGKLGGGTSTISAKTVGSKITTWKKIGTEKAMIEHTPVICDAYQVQIMEKGPAIVKEYSLKIWVSDSVPFGVVVSEMVTRFFLCEGVSPATTTEVSILEHYSLK
jgi:hypothetical protein